MIHQLPAGLIDHHYEFFVSDDLHAYCLNHGHVIDYDHFSEQLLAAIEEQMNLYPVKLAAYGKMFWAQNCRRPNRLELIRMFLSCNYGGFDAHPDMVEGVLQEPEYWPCPYRGSCEYEGIGCDGLKTANGEFLSRREIEIIKLIAAGELDKNIAFILNIAKNTVTTHTRNIRRKTGLFRKVDIARFATQKHLIA